MNVVGRKRGGRAAPLDRAMTHETRTDQPSHDSPPTTIILVHTELAPHPTKKSE